MYKNDSMSEKAKLLARKVHRRIRHQPYQEVSEITPLFIRGDIYQSAKKTTTTLELSEPFAKLDESGNDDCATNPWRVPADANVVIFLLRWPITFTLWCTIPDARRFKRFYLLTFINCVLWIGCISYMVVFIATNVGEVSISQIHGFIH